LHFLYHNFRNVLVWNISIQLEMNTCKYKFRIKILLHKGIGKKNLDVMLDAGYWMPVKIP